MKIRNRFTKSVYNSKDLEIPEKSLWNFVDETENLKFGNGWEEVKETNEWQPIERDKNGFALNNSLDKIFDKLPVEVLFDDKNNSDLSIELITDNCDIYGYRGDIERKTYYTHYRRIELPKK